MAETVSTANNNPTCACLQQG